MVFLRSLLFLIPTTALVLDKKQPQYFDVKSFTREKVFETFKAAKQHQPRSNNGQILAELDETAMLSLEKAPRAPRDLYSQPWQARWTPMKRLGNGGTGEAWLVQNKHDLSLAVAKRAPYPGRLGEYIKWQDYNTGNPAIDQTIQGMREECAWAYHLQKFGLDYKYATRFMFMQCWETNIAPLTAVDHPLPDHEIYLVVSFAGAQLNELSFTNVGAAQNILQQLTNALHYMKLAGIVHHDLKGPNILYSENVGENGEVAGGHIVVIDFGGMVPVTKEGITMTPSYVPEDYLTKGLGVSRDVFSMAGVISEVLCGHNIVMNYVVTNFPFPTNWSVFNGHISTLDSFSQLVVDTAAHRDQTNPIQPGPGVLTRVQVLQGLAQEFPHFMDLWRHMFSNRKSVREEAADKMWRMFLYHGDEKEAFRKQQAAWNQMLMHLDPQQREEEIYKARKHFKPDSVVLARVEYDRSRAAQAAQERAVEAHRIAQAQAYQANAHYGHRARHAHQVVQHLYADVQQPQGRRMFRP